MGDEEEDDPDLLPEEYVNDEVTSTGVEFELVKQAQHGSTGRLSYSYNKAEDRLFNPLYGDSKASPHMVKLNLMVPFLNKGTRAGLEVQYNSKRIPQRQGCSCTCGWSKSERTGLFRDGDIKDNISK